MCSRYRLLVLSLLQLWVMGLWSPGDPEAGGDSGDVQDQLKGVQQIQASDGAFAAILSDGSVVTWGHSQSGADSRAVHRSWARGRAV